MTNRKKVFLQELKDHYKDQFDRGDVIDSKSGQLITVAGIFVPLLFGFSSLIIDKGNPTSATGLLITGLLVTSLSLAVACIFYCALALRIKMYIYVYASFSFFDKDTLNNNTVLNYVGQSEDSFYDEAISEYLEANKENFQVNDEKAQKLKTAQTLFISGLVLVPILVIMSFLFFV